MNHANAILISLCFLTPNVHSVNYCIAPNKDTSIIFLSISMNICCGSSSEPSHGDGFLGFHHNICFS